MIPGGLCVYVYVTSFAKAGCARRSLCPTKIPDHVAHLVHRALDVLAGDWASASITFYCRAPGCTSNNLEQYRDMAVKNCCGGRHAADFSNPTLAIRI